MAHFATITAYAIALGTAYRLAAWIVHGGIKRATFRIVQRFRLWRTVRTLPASSTGYTLNGQVVTRSEWIVAMKGKIDQARAAQL